MTFSINRRKFLGASVAASVAAAGPTLLTRLLASKDAKDQVFAILKETLSLDDRFRPVVAEFTKSLQTSQQHAQTPDGFKRALVEEKDEDGLKLYVTAEFIASTSYLAYAAGHVASVRMLKERHETGSVASSFV